MNRIDVTCAATVAGWSCTADADDGRTSGRHVVTVATADAERLASARGQADVERLVHETMAFLLEREPRSSIFSSFDLTVVGRYFPEYEAEMAHRLAP